MKVNIFINEALCFLLEREYFKTFEVIDGYSRNPDGLNFYKWLRKQNLITEENLIEIEYEINKMDLGD